MPKNVMKLLKPSPHRQRNDFDLSHRHVFDANFGEVLPATCIETVPGDNITLHASDLLRAIPFVSSPFLRAKQHLDVWFVPYHDLWHQFDAFITMKEEPVSSAFKQAKYCPHFTRYHLKQAVDFVASGQTVTKDIIGRDIKDRSYYLLELLGYGDIKNSAGNASIGTYSVNPFRLAAYNYIWYNEYRQVYYDDGKHNLGTNGNVAQLFSFDDLTCQTSATANLTSRTNATQILSASCQMRYRTWKKDLFTGVLPSTQFDVVSTVPFTGSVPVSLSGTATLNGTTGTDSNRHDFVNADGVPVGINDIQWNDNINNPAVIGVLPKSSASVLQDRRLSVYLGDVINPGSYARLIDNGGKAVYDVHDHTLAGSASVVASGTAGLSGNAFDVLALRRAEAVQIWRENALRAGNHIKDNMMAHYGVASDFNDHRPTYLGSVSAPLNIGDIAATANSSTGINNVVGDIAGKGVSSLSEKVFKYHAKDFGVIMVMFSMLPEAEYDAYGVDRCNQLLEREDFFTPEFENLGLEAVPSINFAPGNGSPTQSGKIIGYAPRYYAYKTRLDKVFGQFVGNGIFRSWVSQRSDVTQYLQNTFVNSMPLQFLYVDPKLYDVNFNVGVSVSPQFLVDLYFDVDAVRPMSVIGMPFS